MINIEDCIDLTNIPFDEWKTKYIGNGYRYCSYKAPTNDTNNGVIYLFGYDINGNPQNFVCEHRPHIKYVVKYKTDEKDIYGRNIATKYFRSERERREFVRSSGATMTIIENFKPENEFLHMVFDDVALNEDFNTQKQRIFFYDIETEIGDTFEYAKTANQRINAFTIYDTLTEKYYIWSLQKVNLDFSDEYDENGNIVNECRLKDVPKEKFEVFDFFNDNEARMFVHFLDWWEHNYPDVLCGFNSQSFDDVYLINRIERVLGNPENVDNGSTRLSRVTKRLSPVGKVSIRENNVNDERANKGAEQISNIDGIFQADMLILFRDKFKIDQPLDGGNSLDNIGEVKCGIHKIHYKNIHAKGHPVVQSLKELYEKDWDRFIKYNVMDVEVLKTVEDVVKTIPLARTIVCAGLCNYDTIYSSISYLIGSLAMFSKTQMKKTMVSFQQKKPTAIAYEGAYVFPPTPNLYNGGVACVDFNSLYPNSIIAGNMSVETYVGKISRFPITDPTHAFFTKEPPIDLYGTDTTTRLQKTESEAEYTASFGDKFNGVEDKDIKEFYLLPANGQGQKKITRKQLDELLETKCIFTRNNTLFLKHSVKKGVISAWSEHFYKLRKSTKKKGQKLALDLHKGIITENIEETKELIQNLDNAQQARKIALNSVYGCISTNHSPCYNSYISQSITRTGKFCNQSSSEYIRKCFKEKFGIDDKYVNLTSGDTDTFLKTSKIRIKR